MTPTQRWALQILMPTSLQSGAEIMQGRMRVRVEDAKRTTLNAKVNCTVQGHNEDSNREKMKQEKEG